MAEPSIQGGVEPHIQQFAEIYDLPVEVARRVVEGELTLEDAVEGHFAEPALPEPADPAGPAAVPEPPVALPSAEGPAAGRARVANYDPAFRAAVKAGRLTVQQAVERGDRQAFATRLANRHGIPMAQALKIADNRVRLAEVLQKQREVEERVRARARAARKNTPRSRRARSRRARRIQMVVMSLSLVGVVLAGFWGLDRWRDEQKDARMMAERFATPPASTGATQVGEPRPDPATPTDMISRLVDIEKNDQGMLARVVGPDPRAVLNAYCGAVPGFQPLGLTDTVPPFTGARLGVFRDLSTAEQKSIVIRRDHRSGQWRTGDGSGPITPRVEKRPLDLHPTR